MIKNTESGYGILARLFHWISFILIILLTLKGLSFEDMAKGPEKIAEIGNHKSMGTIFLILIAVRLLWKGINPTPKALSNNNAMNKVAAIISGLLYLLMFVQPLSAILMSQAKGYPVSVFNAFNVPTLVDKSESLANLFAQIHHFAWIAIIVLVAIHVLGSLKHHFMLKNDTLMRMIVSK